MGKQKCFLFRKSILGKLGFFLIITNRNLVVGPEFVWRRSYGSLNWAAYMSVSKKRRIADGETSGGELELPAFGALDLQSLVPFIAPRYERSVRWAPCFPKAFNVVSEKTYPMEQLHN